MPKEISVVREDELEDGPMKEIQVNGVKVLLTKLDGVFYAIGGECSHYGGPLAEGFLSGDVVTCPLHQARFDVATGAVHEPPALDDMCGFSVRVEGGRVRGRRGGRTGRGCERARPGRGADQRGDSAGRAEVPRHRELREGGPDARAEVTPSPEPGTVQRPFGVQ